MVKLLLIFLADNIYFFHFQGGLSTREEMCITFLYVYPKTAFRACSSLPIFDTYHNVTGRYFLNFHIKHVRIQRGDRRSGPPEKSQKTKVSYS